MAPPNAGRYKLDRRLGGGGMAEVFLAHLEGADGFSRPVAVKRVLDHLVTDASFVEMFVFEARLCAKLQHPNIVSVLDFDRDENGRPFLVLELVDGPSLADLAATGSLPIPVAIHIAMEILRGLAYAHDLPPEEDDVRGIVHRDLSPHNVLLSWEGAIKVSDFGIAKMRAASQVTASELLKGKPAYMSPEQANGEALDGRSDLFSLGIVLWELLVGRALFTGQTTQETLARVLFAPVPSPRSLRKDIPQDLERIVMRLLARERGDRFGDANSAVAALASCSDTTPTGRDLLVAHLDERLHSRNASRNAGTAETVRALPAPRDAKRGKRRLALVIAIAIPGVVLGVVALRAGDTDTAARQSGIHADSARTNTGRFDPSAKYFDFDVPRDWVLTFRGKQARMVPPGLGAEDFTSLIVSPVLLRGPEIPAPAALHEQALAYELRLTDAKLLAKNGPYPARSDYGLTGSYWEVTLRRDLGDERRLYVTLVDEIAYYGLSFVAPPATFDEHVGAFWTAVRSIKPLPRPAGFKGSRPSQLFGE